jgi:phosphatidylglycerophosphate synthase
MRSETETPPARLRDFLATNRGGGLYSEAVSQPVGAVIALVSARRGIAPTVLSLVNVILGVSASAVVVAFAEPAAAGGLPGWLPGLVALVAWQLAYAFDCADGQLARVTGQTSAAGARLDVLCDIATQIALVTALCVATVVHRPGTPAWLVAVFASTWMVNLVTSVMQGGPNAASMVASRAPAVRLVKLVRDYGAVILVAGAVLTFAPGWTIVVIWAFTAVNGLFLVASIGFAARSSLPTRRPPVAGPVSTPPGSPPP